MHLLERSFPLVTLKKTHISFLSVQNAVNVTMRLVKQPGNPQLYKRHTVEHHMLKLKLETMV